MNILLDQTDKFHIEFSGPIKTCQPDLDNLLTLYDVEISKGRLDKKSIANLKVLRMDLNHLSYLISKGVTHIIVYECLNK